MSEMFSYSVMEAIVILLIASVGIIILVGFVLAISCSYEPDMRGRRSPKPITPVGVGLCALGVILGLSWNII